MVFRVLGIVVFRAPAAEIDDPKTRSVHRALVGREAERAGLDEGVALIERTLDEARDVQAEEQGPDDFSMRARR